jgi:hypothetical protein
MSTPKTERMILKPRTETERVAITLEYLSSFVIWAESLSVDELVLLNENIENLVHHTNSQNLNQFLIGCTEYIAEEGEE